MKSFTDARTAIGGLKGLMTKLGDAPEHEHKWGSLPKCPFCGHKDCSGVFEQNGTDFFKCHHTSCTSAGVVMTEIGYLSARRGLSQDKPVAGGASPAYEEFLKLAGCWEDAPAAAPKTAPAPIKLDESTVLAAAAAILAENEASIRLIQRACRLGYAKAAAVMDELERRKVVGPAKGTGQRDILIQHANQKTDDIPMNPVLAAEASVPVESKTSEYLPSATEKVVPLFEPPVAGGPPLKGKPEEDSDSEMPARLALEEFYKQLKLSQDDDDMLYRKRGLESSTNMMLGFVSSPTENRACLEKLLEDPRFTIEDLLDSGLFLPADAKAKKVFRPNSQFYGMGQVGKKPKEERKNKEDKWVWGMVHPVIVPYFDETGRVVKLRPHKGGAPGNTLCGAAKVYVPRDPKRAPDVVEYFPRVVICEGEFKAASLWRIIGGGSTKKKPWGVCAIPGINFGANYELREELNVWLSAIGCVQVIVAFDDQDKTGKPMRDKYDALIWARYLAADLARTLHIKAKVLVLPTAWRDEKGKADWDGMIAKRQAELASKCVLPDAAHADAGLATTGEADQATPPPTDESSSEASP